MHDFYQEYVSSGQAGRSHATLQAHLAPNRPYLERWIHESLIGIAAPRIVDAACGSGKLVSVLRERGYTNVTGVDLSREQVALGTQWGIQGLVCGDAIAYLEEVPPSTVDVVFAIDFLEHLDVPDALRFIAAASRALSGDGRLILHVPNGQSPFCGAIRYADITHARAYTRQSLDQLLFPSGLRVAEVKEDRPPVHGVVSLFRRVIWTLWRSGLSFVWAAETGEFPDALSRNILVVARRFSVSERANTLIA